MIKTAMIEASKVESSEISSRNTEFVPTIVPASTNENISQQITTQKLNGKNFLQWSRSVQMVVRGKGKIGYLDGTINRSGATDATNQNWEVHDSIVMA